MAIFGFSKLILEKIQKLIKNSFMTKNIPKFKSINI